MEIRGYNAEKDLDACCRIWQECGWMKENNTKSKEFLQSFIASGRGNVATVNDEAECLVIDHDANIRFLNTPLPLRAITAVTVSRVLRQQGVAGDLVARALGRAAEEGYAMAALGIFDQGFYNKFGFGNFPYIHNATIDPSTLDVPRLTRPPLRLTQEDLPRMVENMKAHKPCHGHVTIPATDYYRFDMHIVDNGFGLGFAAPDGRLTHHFWAEAKGENGPYEVIWMNYEDFDGLIELLSAIKSLADQIYSITIREPQGLQIQDLIKRPFRQNGITSGGAHKTGIRATAWGQARILNLPTVVEALSLPGKEMSFNLQVNDPLTSRLSDDFLWKGVAGPWTLHLGPKSQAQPGEEKALPTMKVSVNALTRLLFGVRTATALSVTDELDAPRDLLEQLDEHLCLPVPDMVTSF